MHATVTAVLLRGTDSAEVARWGANDHNFRSELIIRHNLTAQCYMDNVLNPYLLPLLYQHGHHLLFQQDNAHPHTTQVTQHFFTVNINTLEWPPLSLHLNPIAQLDKHVRNRPRNLQELVCAGRGVVQDPCLPCPQPLQVYATLHASMYPSRWRAHALLTLAMHRAWHLCI